LKRVLEESERLIKARPDDAEAYNSRGAAYGNLGRRKEAEESFRKAIEIMPDYADAHHNLAMELVAQGRYEEAADEYRAALRLRADWAEVMNNLAWLIATRPALGSGQTGEAVRLAERACELSGYSDPSSLDTLACAYASAGRFTEAVETARKALALAEAAGQVSVRNVISYHLSFYAQGSAYIEPAAEAAPTSGRP
jgi:Flp pilus assembly protein TadD